MTWESTITRHDGQLHVVRSDRFEEFVQLLVAEFAEWVYGIKLLVETERLPDHLRLTLAPAGTITLAQRVWFFEFAHQLQDHGPEIVGTRCLSWSIRRSWWKFSRRPVFEFILATPALEVTE
jgi:hypothetical protein